jgi:endonuclease/exonuclease/phosphatase family metal-dependent hydrolase
MKNKTPVVLFLLPLVLGSCSKTATPSSSSPASSSSTEAASISLSSYSVLYPEKDSSLRRLALNLSSSLEEKTGISLPVISDGGAKSGKEIRLGKTNRTITSSKAGKYTLAPAEEDIELVSDTVSGLAASVKELVSLSGEDGKLVLPEEKDGEYQDLSLRVMSYNIRMSGEDRWGRLSNVIERNAPDILGTQEVSTVWHKHFQEDLEGYTAFGRDRGDSTKEANFILYKTSEFDIDLAASGTCWYSSTPDTPSKLKESTYNRIFTYAYLTRKSDQKDFLYINTHLDLSQHARMESVKMLAGFVSQCPNVPVYITGDFNTGYNWTYDGSTWGELPVADEDADDKLEEEGFLNARKESSLTTDAFTYPTTLYPNDAAEEKPASIDYCFGKGKVLFDTFKVDNALPDNPNDIPGCGKDASDHYPVIADTILY